MHTLARCSCPTRLPDAAARRGFDVTHCSSVRAPCVAPNDGQKFARGETHEARWGRHTSSRSATATSAGPIAHDAIDVCDRHQPACRFPPPPDCVPADLPGVLPEAIHWIHQVWRAGGRSGE